MPLTPAPLPEEFQDAVDLIATATAIGAPIPAIPGSMTYIPLIGTFPDSFAESRFLGVCSTLDSARARVAEYCQLAEGHTRLDQAGFDWFILESRINQVDVSIAHQHRTGSA